MHMFVHAVPVVFPSLSLMLEMCHFSLKWWWTSSAGTTSMLSLKTATNSIMKPWRWPSMSSPRARRCTWPSGSKPSMRASRCGANKNVRVYCSGDNKVRDQSCAWPSTAACLPTPSPRSPCCTWRRPGCRRKNKFTLWYFYVVICVTITIKDLSILLKPMLVMKRMTIWRQGPHFEVKEEMHHPRY